MKWKSKPEIGISILSIFLAFLVWLSVMNLGDPYISKKISGIKVIMVNGSAIEDLDKIYSVKNESDMISVNVREQRSVVDFLNADDFVARADLSKWNELGNVPIVVSCKNDRLDNDSYVQSSYSLQLDVEDLKTKTYPIEVQVSGEPAVGYIVENMGVSPTTVSIKAGETVIANIDKVLAPIDLMGVGTNTKLKSPLTVYDKDGKMIDYNKIQFIGLSKASHDVNVSVHILKTNKIPVDVELFGTLPDGYAVESVECNPSQIEVKGGKGQVSKIESVDIKDVSFNLNGITDSFTREIDIRQYLPKGVVLADGQKDKVSVKVHIKQLNSLDLSIPFNEIRLKNLPENLDFELMGTGTVSVKIYGSADDLLKVDSSNLSPSLDLKSCNEEKTYQLPLDLVLPEGCKSSSGNLVYVRCYQPTAEIVEDETEGENIQVDNNESETQSSDRSEDKRPNGEGAVNENEPGAEN